MLRHREGVAAPCQSRPPVLPTPPTARIQRFVFCIYDDRGSSVRSDVRGDTIMNLNEMLRAIAGFIVLLSLFLYRPWCRYLCPLHKNTMEGLFDRSRKNAKKLWLSLRPN